ncbi:MULTISPECIES: D-alanyl-D-alanine carboxypeptidase family protein [Deefgea]|uniref:serine-type D-Ala-D-Ala carboxypeptidase n=1 Tax=Deefgea chitinilytica TaxID=570276 RepID=A0ABS2CB62_9NEIS|nr:MULTISPECIES: D-alanyl-D-alanine carboxypeptidase family protein [Deefgea]MBM5571397.1 D-alanyl-D-alanine carboxypeptidase [Deefgea chitinilytica]MBM9888630.1 D-alanyl-D-alanine carboxypeptidase [Deefgea sp. CFH1-16]
MPRIAITASLIAALFSSSIAHAFVPPVPEIAAKSYYLYDKQSGQVLAARDPDMKVEPASLTKLMTAYLTFKAVKEGKLKLDQMLTVSEKGWKTEGSRMYLDPKVPASVDDLIKGMIVQSGNDACVTLAEAIAGSEEVFAQLMNKEAKRLGLHDSFFTNSTGLPDPKLHVTTSDLSRLASAIITDFPEFYHIYSIKEFKYNNISQPNRNLLLYRDPFVDGMKTGHTESAGYNLVASSKRDDRRLISVVVGTTSPEVRATESSKLLNWGAQFYETPRLYTAKQAVQTVPVWKGKADTVGVGFMTDQFITVPKGDAAKIKIELTSQQPLIAPIKEGQQVGTLKIMLDGKMLSERPVVAIAAVEEANIFGRAWDTIRLWWKGIFG